MSTALSTALAVILILAWGVWTGGLAAVIGVSLTSAKTLSPEERTRFFSKYGPVYFTTTLTALFIAYAIGWTLLSRLPWTGEYTRMAVASTVMVIVTLVGVAQARGMTRMRNQLLAHPGDAELAKKIRTNARIAAGLRGLIVLMTIGITLHAAGVVVRALGG